MINQVSTSMNKSVYAPVQSSNGAPYYITKPIFETQKQEDEHEKGKKSNKAWFAVATTAVAVGVGVLFLAKGPSTTLKSTMNRWYRDVIDKTNKLKLIGNKSWSNDFKLGFLKVSRAFMTKSKILFNGAPLKDALVMKYIKKSPKAKSYSDIVSDYFEKVSVKTSKRYYNKTYSRLDEMYAAFDKAGERLSKEDKDKLYGKIENIRKLYNQGFSETARNRRMLDIKKGMAGIDDEVYNKTYGNIRKFLESQKSNEPFVSENVAAKAKATNFNNVEYYRSSISNNVADNHDAIRKLFEKLDYVIDPNDPNSRKYIKNIGKVLDNYKTGKKSGTEPKELLFDGKISKNLQGLKEYMLTSNKYDKRITELYTSNIDDICKTLDKNKRGEIQEILQLLKSNISPADYQKVKQVAKKASKSLNKSVDMEADKLFDKVRDLIIGSAPMDVLGLISSLGVVGWGLLKADNNDERISATLKYGIPAVGGVATTLYCTLGLVSAGPSLIIGLISGALINKLGIEADHMRKKHSGKQFNANEETIAKLSVDKIKEKSKEVEQKVKQREINSK